MAVRGEWLRVGGVPVLTHRAHKMSFDSKLRAVLDACAQWEPLPHAA